MKIVRNTAASNYLRGRAAMSPESFGRLPAELKARAFTVARIEDVRTLERIRDAAAEIPDGADWNKARAEIAGEIGGDGAKARAELVLRVNALSAYAAGRHADQTATADDFPFWMYQCSDDGRERASHKALHGKIVRWDDPFWRRHYPPWEWGCRCWVVKLTPDMAEEFGGEADSSKIDFGSEGDFKFDPWSLQIDLQKLIDSQPKEDRNFLSSVFGNEIDGTGETIFEANAPKEKKNKRGGTK